MNFASKPWRGCAEVSDYKLLVVMWSFFSNVLLACHCLHCSISTFSFVLNNVCRDVCTSYYIYSTQWLIVRILEIFLDVYSKFLLSIG